MGRPIGYDTQAVRQQVLAAFWSAGYAETSLGALERATGLDRRQLYNGFGDKRAMFVSALDDFNDMAGQRFFAPLEAAGAGPEEIVALFHRYLELCRSEDGRRGCLMCNTASEKIASDPLVAGRLNAYFDRIEAAYRNALPAHERHRAPVLLATHVALCVLARAGASLPRLEAMAAAALAAHV